MKSLKKQLEESEETAHIWRQIAQQANSRLTNLLTDLEQLLIAYNPAYVPPVIAATTGRLQPPASNKAKGRSGGR